MFTRLIVSIGALLLFPAMVHAQVLIKNVSVADVEKKKWLTNQDVIALDGKITYVGSGRKYKLPEGTEVIDGTGKFLIPGLVDAHIHFFQSGGMYARPDVIDLRKYRPYQEEINWVHRNMDDFLRRYAHTGITSVIDVGSTIGFLRQRDTFRTKDYAPQVFMTGPLLTTWVPEPYKNLGDDEPFILMTDEAQTRAAVTAQVNAKADFIKIWYILNKPDKESAAKESLPLVKAAIDEAKRNGLRVAVHATEAIAAKLAVEAGADYLVHSVDDEPLSDSFIQLLKTKKTVLCPTLTVMDNYAQALTRSFPFNTAELNVANPQTVGSLLDYPLPDTAAANRIIRRKDVIIARNRPIDSLSLANLAKLVRAGVTIATGTDAGNIGTQHASSYFAELKAMRAAGMDHWALLQASTVNGARVLARDAEQGTIAVNKLADMVLLRANPIDSLANWQTIERVFLKGKAFHPDSLLRNTPEMLAQQQLNAYNAHNLEAFLAPYADDVEIYTFPDKLEAKGKDAMRKMYAFIERTPKLYCRLLNRIVEGNMVIDHEEVWGFGNKPFYGVAIYVTEQGKIRKVYFPN